MEGSTVLLQVRKTDFAEGSGALIKQAVKCINQCNQEESHSLGTDTSPRLVPGTVKPSGGGGQCHFSLRLALSAY